MSFYGLVLMFTVLVATVYVSAIIGEMYYESAVLTALESGAAEICVATYVQAAGQSGMLQPNASVCSFGK